MRLSSWRKPLPGFGLLLLASVSATAPAAAANLASVTVNPTAIFSGSPVELTVALDTAAPAGGAFVTLSTLPPGIVDPGTAMVVPAGKTSNSVPVQKTGAVTSDTLVTIEATYGAVVKSATVMVSPRTPVRGVAGDLWADVVLGKPDFTEVTPNIVTGKRLFNPGGVLVDRSVNPNRLYVYDGGNSRILMLSHLGTCAGGSNAEGNCTTNSDCPGSTCAIQEGRDADFVIGQPNLNTSACNGDGAFQLFPTRRPASASTLCGMPEPQVSLSEGGSFANMAVDSAGNFYVADWDNNRVLRYDSPFTTDRIADDVWGQADFAGNDCNRGHGLCEPFDPTGCQLDAQSLCFRNKFNNGFTGGVAIDSAGNLWVTDNSNNRVLRFPYNSGTGRPDHVADLVLGQPDFVSFTNGTALNRMFSPAAVRVDATGKVYVADSLNNRILVFNPPITNGMTATKINYAFRDPRGLELDQSGGLWVSDSQNFQLLYFANGGGAPQKVLFKDVPNSTGACGGNYTGDGPMYYSEGDGFFIDSWNYCGSYGSIGVDSDGNVFATVSGPWQDLIRFPAPFPSPTAGIAHSGDKRIFRPWQFATFNEVGLAGMDSARGVAVAEGQLIAADRGRLLFWNNPPNLTNGQTPDGFVGASDPRIQNTGSDFMRIREDGGLHLWAMRGDKILAYTLPLVTGASPVATIGSPLPVLGGGSLTWDSLIVIGGIAPAGAGDKIWVSDPVRHRVFRIKNALTSPVADIILGQTTYTGTRCNRGTSSPSQTSLCYPAALRLDPAGNLYVSDHSLEIAGNHRLLEFDASLLPAAPTTAVYAIPASRVFGTGGSFTALGCQGDTQELCTALWEPAFKPDGQLVIGRNGYSAPPFPYIYANPLVSQHVNGFLNDFYSMSYASTFDSNQNLYVTDLNRGRLMIYLNPITSAPPATFTLTVNKLGGGTGTVKSAPLGIDCGTDCSQTYIGGTAVTLSTVPGTNSIFAGWSGNADCADGIVTMDAAKTCTATFNVKPDLIVFALTAPTAALAGSTINVTDTTKNNTGTGPAGASTTRFYFSTNTTLDGGDQDIGNRAVPVLAPGAANTLMSSVTIPAGTPTGNYYLFAKADADNVLTESIETNNTKYAAIHIGPPDLLVSAFSVPTTSGVGSSIVATNTTKDQTGTGLVPTSSFTRFYLSSNSILDVLTDPQIGQQNIGPLLPGASEAHSTTLSIPVTTTPATYYVFAKADADGDVTETNESNNTASDTIVIKPDLIVLSLTGVPGTSATGQSFTVNDTTKNQGAAHAPASTTRFYLSLTNSTLGSGDVLLNGNRDAGALNAGAFSAGPTTLTIPVNTAGGNYYIIAVADGPMTPTGSGSVPETVETNNTKAAPIHVNPADLLISALEAPASAVAGAMITVTDTTKNQGQGIAGPTTTRFYLSSNTTFGGDTALASRAVPQLGSNATSNGSTSVQIPPGTTPGTWYILARADDGLAVSEASETNNVANKLITITP